MKRIVIAGSPRAGKTTLADELGEQLGVDPMRSDDLIETHAHGEDSAEVARWFNEPGPWVAEGVTMVRGLRKWLETHPAGKPCDEVVVLRSPVKPLNEGQRTQAKGIDTVWCQIAGKLAARGVTVVVRG